MKKSKNILLLIMLIVIIGCPRIVNAKCPRVLVTTTKFNENYIGTELANYPLIISNALNDVYSCGSDDTRLLPSKSCIETTIELGYDSESTSTDRINLAKFL